ncbi:MucB/RseB C-terminal domain-containing protein [Chitinimonas sp.]|uniref:MucB/RseB C-terminal domain-containing protein n=1 Tax=Chitinimonas sp. TaxID=1934313 RepID=UPI002F92B732
MSLRLGLCGLLLAVSAQAADLLTTPESANLLRKMGAAARVLNYSGVYLYQHTDMLETFRLVHAFDAGGEQERRESLDGVPREFVRLNDQITGYMPDAKPMVLDRRAANKFFPGIIPDQIIDVLANYNFKRLNTERVAGYDCQSILLEPKDKLRHPHKLCVEPNSGLMLKSTMYSPEGGGALEQFSFTQLEIGGPIDKRALKSVLASRALPADPPGRASNSAPMPATDLAQFDTSNLPNGFRLVKEARSAMPGKRQLVQHFLYSDGMVTVSIFIEPAGNGPVTLPLAQGSSNISFFSRQVDGWRITALGEVPLRTVQLFAQSFSPR